MRLLVRIAILIVVLAALAGAAVYFGANKIYGDFKGYSGEEQFVEIPPGVGPVAIGERLVAAGVVQDPIVFRGALWLTGRARQLQAGEYRFDRPMNAIEVVEKIARGDVYRRFVTFREGLTIAEMSQVYEQSGLGPAADFRKAAKDASLIKDVDAEASDLEGYLFPDTYSLPRETTAPALITQMVGSFRKVFNSALQEAARAQQLTVREAVTLASLVEKETAVPAERPVVAAVYLNRQRLGMPMQADPTVIFAMLREGRYHGNIRKEDLQIDSPYNTYKYPGLPPGPIAAPGKASLEAAVRPADVQYLYFVSRNDGSHVFATTLDEHNRNVQEWQVKFFRDRRTLPTNATAPPTNATAPPTNATPRSQD